MLNLKKDEDYQDKFNLMMFNGLAIAHPIQSSYHLVGYNNALTNSMGTLYP